MIRAFSSILAFAGLVWAQQPDFVRQVRPILAKHCFACHGAALQSNGLRLDNGADALRGGYSGPAILPGNSAKSRLIERVSSGKEGVRMPPAGPQLSAVEVATLRAWIDAGAAWPSETAAAPKAAQNPKSKHWAFQPVSNPAPPVVKNVKWVRNPIDAFVLAKLEKEDISPSPEAPKETLLRRLTLDLIGLPPTPQQVFEFLADTSESAYERAVDRLLATPQYGERWARPWLDLAHYADSDGYEKDQVRPYAWRWRNWVIDALNRDLPFDRFTIEQLAGDLLPNRTAEQWVATGFLRNTLTNREAGVDREEARFEQIVNRTNTVATTWLGLTMGCAQCHDHKYDPISQRDYYQLLAFFESADEQNIDAPMAGEIGPYLAALPEYTAKREALLQEFSVSELFSPWEAKMREAIDFPGRSPEWDFSLTSMKAMFDNAVKVLKRSATERTPRQQRELVDYFVFRTGSAPELDQNKITKFKELRAKLRALDEEFPSLTQAPVMVEDEAAPATCIRIKGDWRQKGISVPKNTPAVLPAIGTEGKPDRLALARWLVSNQNPLTARVQVNRSWQEFFGRGLVRTSEDFGTMGEKPSHPELLDWLASNFIEDWSLKRLHKTIVMSATYRQSSNARKELSTRDPENTLLARQARLRLPAELVRDAALSASGLLDTRIGGPSVRPPQPAGVAELGYGNSVKWVASKGKDRYRRGLYIHFQRTTPYPMLMNFDTPDSNVACTRRSRSNTPLQSLNLLNDEVFFEAANALAWRIENQAARSLTERLDTAFLFAVGRQPTESERRRLAQYHDEQARIFAKENSKLSPWVGVARVVLNLDEFITRE
jgi:hypothetical protein